MTTSKGFFKGFYPATRAAPTVRLVLGHRPPPAADPARISVASAAASAVAFQWRRQCRR